MNETKQTLILKEIDQLERATNIFSNSTNWMKKACIAIIAAIVPITLEKNFCQSASRLALFVFGITFLFWILDSYCYYFQKRLRWLMGQKFKAIDSNWPYGSADPEKASIPKSLFNWSHIIYYFFLISLLIPTILEVAKLVCKSCEAQ
ncbi:hypothetical protein [uncultured Fibrobacter sp.]|uniref:hypothetical protein n=1 Tax=uncultured Fibrobacter sp. TaxID=261512 RepID=UPI0025F950F0|nr:hypothetical protein [uncultured Fibrobacter sp.]